MILLFVASFVLFVPALLDASAQTVVATPAGMRPSSGSLGPGTPLQDAPTANYDEQLGTTFTQSFTSLAYNVTAIAQVDSDGYGPAYLLNGLSTAGYWYQVGVSYHWPYTQSNGESGYISGFSLNYETFNAKGASIFPADGGGGIANFTGQINSGDTVLLRLYFSNGDVVMSAEDQDTGASASVSYSAAGASSFVGNAQGPANRNGFFTGLMTEWYHGAPYYTNEEKATFSDPQTALTSAWMWMDEFNVNTLQSIFSTNTPSPTTYNGSTRLQEFSFNGTTEYSDAYEFITGALTNATQSPSVPLTLSFSIQGGGTGYSPPMLTYISNETTQTTPITETPTTYDLDPDSNWSISTILNGSSTNERWITNQTTTGTATFPQAILLEYYNQYQVSFSYAVHGVSGSYSAPMVTYRPLGSVETIAAGETVWADAGSSYNYTNPLAGSTPAQRWETESASGSIESTETVSPTYYEQDAVGTNLSVIGGDPPGGLEISGTAFGTLETSSLPPGVSSIWLDSGSSYSLQNLTQGSTGAQRWDTLSPMNGSVSLGASIDGVYYHQYQVDFQYSVVGGGATYVAPDVTFVQFGGTSRAEANSSAWVDAGTDYSYAATIVGPDQTERWLLPSSNGTVSSSGTIDSAYYHQYLLSVSYSSKGGQPAGPQFSYTSGGAPDQVTINVTGATEIWSDSGSQYALTNPLVGSDPQERWEAASGVNGTVSSAAEISPTYFQQFLVIADYSIVGGGSPGAPVFSGTALGQPFAIGLSTNSSIWLDSGSDYSMSQLLSSTTSGERWITNGTIEGTVSGPESLLPLYHNQYYVELMASPGTGGSIPTGQGWFDAGTAVSASATPANGWAFEGWQGNDQQFSNSGSLDFSVDSPVNETAVFYPGLDIVASSSASVSYIYGATSGTVPSGKNVVIFAPQSSNVTLKASPTTFLYAFERWEGASSSTSTSVAIQIDGPLVIETISGYNYLSIAIILGAVLLVVFGTVLALYGRTKKK